MKLFSAFGIISNLWYHSALWKNDPKIALVQAENLTENVAYHCIRESLQRMHRNLCVPDMPPTR